MIRSGDHNDRMKEHYEQEQRRKKETGGAGPADAGGARPTLLGVMTDQEVRGALLRLVEDAGADGRRRLLAGLAGGTDGMGVRLVFADWLGRDHRSVYSTEAGVGLSTGQFHSGTTFDGAVRLDPDDRAELEAAMASGYVPVFHLIPGAD